MKRIEKRLCGALRYELCSARPEALLNACAMEGLSLTELEILDAYTLRLTIPEGERERFEALAPRWQCELRLLEKTGGSRDRKHLRRRLPLLLAAALVLLTLLYSSLFIWEIELVGAETLGRGELLRALEDSGVAPGVFWPALDADAVRSRMLARLPELAWMTVNVRGSRATVLLLERSPKPEIYRESAAADVRAGASGYLLRLSVLAGTPLVQEGQAVLRGETLVSGRVESLTNAPRSVRARAEALAETWYEITAVCPASAGKSGGEGRVLHRLALCIGKTRVNFYGRAGKALDGYDKIMRETRLGVKGLFALPIRFVCEELRPYAPTSAAAPPVEELQRRLYESLAGRIEGEILSAVFSVSEQDGLLSVTLHARCRENIVKMVDITEKQLT